MSTNVPTVTEIPKLAHSIAETGAVLGLSRSALYRIRKSGQLRTIKLGRRVVVPAHEIARLIGATTESAA